MTLNLARRPFANLRPLRRLAIGLWALGGVATLTAIWLFVAYASGSAEKRAELDRLEAAESAENLRISTLESDLERVDLASQNREVEYLNDRIAERTFAWSGLFDDLAEVLPWDVRVLSLSPLSVVKNRPAGSAAPAPERGAFALRLVGSARDGEALLTFVDRLFAHPSFAEPNLEQERRRNGDELEFSLTVTYRPQATTVAGPALAASGGPASVPRTSLSSEAAPADAVPLGAPGAGTVAESAPVLPVPVAPGTSAALQPPAEGETARPIGQASPALVASEAPPPQPEPRRGWAGVEVASATTAPVPDPSALAIAPGTAPLPLDPVYSSPAGIR